MFQIEVDVGDAVRAFTRVAMGIKQPAPLLMENLGVTLANEVNDQINEGGRPHWEALSPKTIARKMRAGKNNGVLRFTGELLNPSNRSVVVSGHTVALAFSKSYGAYHQTGTKRMPARPLAVVDDATCQSLADAVADFIELTVNTP